MAKYLDQAGLTKLWSIILARFAEKGGTEESIADILEQFNAFKNTAGRANGLAQLDGSGKVPSSQLPSYVDDVLEYANRTAFPATGQDGVIYVDEATNKTYRWSGTDYVEISASLALGETSSTAYAGNKGKANADAIAELQSQKVDKTGTFVKINYTSNFDIKANSFHVDADSIYIRTVEAGGGLALLDGQTSLNSADGDTDNYGILLKKKGTPTGEGIFAVKPIPHGDEDLSVYEILDESMALTTNEIEAICV